jgi:RHS repeat-associated core domain protein
MQRGHEHYTYGARYMNSVTSLWHGVEPLIEEYQLTDSYVYYRGNPIKIIDIDRIDELYETSEKKLHKEVLEEATC